MAPNLHSDLVSHWKLNEPSTDNRVDSHGSNDLQAVNAVTSAAGIIDDALSVQANSRQLKTLSGDDSELAPVGDVDFSIGSWFFREEAGLGHLITRHNGSQGEFSFMLLSNNGTGDMEFWVYSDGTLGSLTTVGTPRGAEDTWRFMQVYHDAAADEIGVRVDAGSWVTAAHNFGVHIGKPDSFRITGNDNNSGSSGWIGRVDSTSFWNRILSDAEWNELYNAGAGLDYPFVPEAVPAERPEAKIFTPPYIVVP
jgi:hypothetical protein